MSDPVNGFNMNPFRGVPAAAPQEQSAQSTAPARGAFRLLAAANVVDRLPSADALVGQRLAEAACVDVDYFHQSIAQVPETYAQLQTTLRTIDDYERQMALTSQAFSATSLRDVVRQQFATQSMRDGASITRRACAETLYEYNQVFNKDPHFFKQIWHAYCRLIIHDVVHCVPKNAADMAKFLNDVNTLREANRIIQCERIERKLDQVCQVVQYHYARAQRE